MSKLLITVIEDEIYSWFI